MDRSCSVSKRKGLHLFFRSRLSMAQTSGELMASFPHRGFRLRSTQRDRVITPGAGRYQLSPEGFKYPEENLQ